MVRLPSTIPKDDVFHLLQNARRRAVLRYLLDEANQGPFVMREVAEEVAAWEYDIPIHQLSADQRKRVYIALYQAHLPKLDNYDIIEYDQKRGSIEPTPLIQVVVPYLEDSLHSDSTTLTPPEDTASPSDLSATVRTILSR